MPGIQDVLLAFGEAHLQVTDAQDDLVGRGLVDAALRVAPRVNADDVTARWDVAHVPTAPEGIADDHPRVVKRAERGVVVLALGLHGLELGALRGIEHGEAIAHQRAMVDERVLHVLRRLSRHGDDADVVDVFQRMDACAIFWIGGSLPYVGAVINSR